MGVDIYKTGIVNASGDNINPNLLLYVPKSYAPTSYTAYQFNMSENLVANQTYTMQLWDVYVSHSEKTEAQTGVWVYWGGGSVGLFNWAGPTFYTNGHADYLVKTFTVTSANASGSGATNSFLNIYNSVGYVAGTLNMKIGAWKLEKGSIATPWCMNPSDAGYVGNHHGFIERSGVAIPASFYTNHIETNEFIEY